jgi:hypothetical protein
LPISPHTMPQEGLIQILSFGMWRRVVWQYQSFKKRPADAIFRFVYSSKHRFVSSRVHGVTSQKMELSPLPTMTDSRVIQVSFNVHGEYHTCKWGLRGTRNIWMLVLQNIKECSVTVHIKRSFKKPGNIYSDAETLILISICRPTWYMVSRWYKPDFHVVVIDSWSFITSWHQGFIPG